MKKEKKSQRKSNRYIQLIFFIPAIEPDTAEIANTLYIYHNYHNTTTFECTCPMSESIFEITSNTGRNLGVHRGLDFLGVHEEKFLAPDKPVSK